MSTGTEFNKTGGETYYTGEKYQDEVSIIFVMRTAAFNSLLEVGWAVHAIKDAARDDAEQQRLRDYMSGAQHAVRCLLMIKNASPADLSDEAVIRTLHHMRAELRGKGFEFEGFSAM